MLHDDIYSPQTLAFWDFSKMMCVCVFVKDETRERVIRIWEQAIILRLDLQNSHESRAAPLPTGISYIVLIIFKNSFIVKMYCRALNVVSGVVKKKQNIFAYFFFFSFQLSQTGSVAARGKK